MVKPKIIFLDWNKTLSNNRFWEQWSNPSHGLNSKFVEIESILFNRSSKLINSWMLGKIASNEVCSIIAKKIKLDQRFLHDELEKSCRNMQFVNKNIKKLLKRLKKKEISLVIATDNMDTFSKYTYPLINNDRIFDNFLNSYDIGCFKYDFIDNKPSFFESFLKNRGVNYNEVVLIDDSVDKKDNFKKIGFKIQNINNIFSINDALEEYV